MKQALKNETGILDLINKIQAQLIVLDQKVNTLINRSVPEVKASPKPLSNNTNLQVKHNERHQERMMHQAICADCGKECTIPFKPSGDRPVYCKDCFSRRKVISMSGIKVEDQSKPNSPLQTITPAADIQKPLVKSKKKTVAVKKPISKKKAAPKKK